MIFFSTFCLILLSMLSLLDTEFKFALKKALDIEIFDLLFSRYCSLMFRGIVFYVSVLLSSNSVYNTSKNSAFCIRSIVHRIFGVMHFP